MNKELGCVVSICCITYNHEKYIEQCLDGFLMQQTDFEFEILIHEDASTDNTATIIRAYEKKYPSIIKPIYQTENQYSKGISISATYNFPRAKGKYIALCEGDDYWTDPLKLQKQVDLIENKPEISMVFHPCFKYINGKRLSEPSFYNSNTNLKVSAEDVLLCEGQFAPTASYLFRKDKLGNLPSWINSVPVGDFFLEMYLLKNNEGIFMPNPMSVYRVDTESSWSVAVLGNIKKKIDFNLEMIKFLNKMKEDFNNISKNSFDHSISLRYLNCCFFYFELNDYESFKTSSLNFIKFSTKRNLIFYKIKLAASNKFIFWGLRNLWMYLNVKN